MMSSSAVTIQALHAAPSVTKPFSSTSQASFAPVSSVFCRASAKQQCHKFDVRATPRISGKPITLTPGFAFARRQQNQ
jgi:hypothetical protein